MKEYHKIQSVFLRDPATKFKTFLEWQWARPEFEYLLNNQWDFTEKVDGTNIRVMYDVRGVTFGGRTESAQMPATLVNKLRDLFPVEKFKDMPELCLYGEGYGAKIQKGGGDYISDGCGFILFDVMINGVWLSRDNVADIAMKLQIPMVPTVFTGKLIEAIDVCRDGFKSLLRATPPEGLVARPMVELRSRSGERVITKIKLKDFARQS